MSESQKDRKGDGLRHKKHAALARPTGGQFHRLEFGFIGAPCSEIRSLCASISNTLPENFKIAYLDAAHPPNGDEPESETNQSPFDLEYLQKNKRQLLDWNADELTSSRSHFNEQSCVFVNGNHFPAHQQVVLLHPKKKESLQRKLDRLTNVSLFVLCPGVDAPFDFLSELEQSDTAVFRIDQVQEITAFLQAEMERAIPALQGLVLAGGKSQRMGQDKGAIIYHQKEQREQLADLLQVHCQNVFLSLNQQQAIDSPYEILRDQFIDLGPMSALLTAFQKMPNSAIFCLPCDLPFAKEDLLKLLVENRNPQKIATCFYNSDTDFPEPLITIWEPRSYPIMLEWLSRGYSCPRKILINSDIEMIQIPEVEWLFNANTPEEREAAIKKIIKS